MLTKLTKEVLTIYKEILDSGERSFLGFFSPKYEINYYKLPWDRLLSNRQKLCVLGHDYYVMLLLVYIRLIHLTYTDILHFQVLH